MFCVLIDENPSCPGFFVDGSLEFGEVPQNITSTWAMSEHFLHDKNIQYAQNYCGGKSIEECCPERYKEKLSSLRLRLAAYKKSIKLAKININDCCLYDLVPEDFLLEYCSLKQKIGMYILENYPKPDNHDFMVECFGLFNRISKRELNFDVQAGLKLITDSKSEGFYRKLKTQNHIKYDPYGTITGRLSTLNGSFPILNFDKKYRKVLKPVNDFFLEIDFNGSEIRVMLGLLGKEQPKYDIHQWNADNIYGGVSREDAKKDFWTFFYNPDSHDEKLDFIYDRQEINQKYYDNGAVKTPFGRVIECDEKVCQNYLLQSTSSDIVIEQALKVEKILINSKSFVNFTVHDSLAIDGSYDDVHLIPEIRDVFENTRIGWMMSNVRVGSNYGNMEKLEVKRK